MNKFNILSLVISLFIMLITSKKTVVSCDEMKFAAIIYQDIYNNPVEAYVKEGWKERPIWPGQFGHWLGERYSNLLTIQSDSSQVGNSTGVDQPWLYTFSFSNNIPLGVNLLKEIWKLMDNIICKNSAALKLSILNANNNTLGDVLTSLNIVDNNYSFYKAALIIELVNGETDNSAGTDYVRIFHKTFNGTEEPHFIHIPKCGKRCPVQRFSKIYKNIFTLSCKIKSSTKNPCSSWGIPIVILTVIIYITSAILNIVYNPKNTLDNTMTPPPLPLV